VVEIAPKTVGTTAPDAAPPSAPPRLGRNLAALAGGQIITWSMTLIWTLVVPRALGPAGVGIIVTSWSVTGVFGIVLGLGTRNYLVRELVVRPGSASRLIGAALVLRILLAPVFAAAILIYAQIAANGYEMRVALYLAAAATILTLLAEPMQAGFQAIERMEYLALSDVINKSSQGLLGVILALIGFRSTGIVACWTITAGVVLILNAFWMRQRVHIPIQLNTNRHELYSVARESIAYWAFGVFMMLYLWIDTVMLSLLTRPEVVGWYGVPTKLFQSLMFLPALMSTAWLPRLVSAHENGGDKLQRESRKPLELLLVASIPICAVTAATAGPVMHVLYGSAYDESVPVLITLALCVPPMYVNIMLNQVLVAAKRQTAWTWVLAGATIFNPLVNLALIPYTEHHYGNGAIGAGIALFLTELGIVAVGLALFGRGLVTRATVRRCVPALVSSGALWGVAYLLRPAGPVIALGAAGIVFLILARVLHLLTPDEVAMLRGLLRRAMGRRGGREPGATSA
jgi:O-antigen/teichoic acid export membrane protein